MTDKKPEDDKAEEAGGITPSTAELNRRLGLSPLPRTLTPEEVDLLRESKREIQGMLLTK